MTLLCTIFIIYYHNSRGFHADYKRLTFAALHTLHDTDLMCNPILTNSDTNTKARASSAASPSGRGRDSARTSNFSGLLSETGLRKNADRLVSVNIIYVL